jgi:primosomal replication protein N
VEHGGLRRTPAGLPALRLKLAHASTQSEAGRQRSVLVETEAVAFGPVAERLARVDPGAQLVLAGFLDRKGANNSQLELHVTEWTMSEPARPDGSETNRS